MSSGWWLYKLFAPSIRSVTYARASVLGDPRKVSNLTYRLKCLPRRQGKGQTTLAASSICARHKAVSKRQSGSIGRRGRGGGERERVEGGGVGGYSCLSLLYSDIVPRAAFLQNFQWAFHVRPKECVSPRLCALSLLSAPSVFQLLWTAVVVWSFVVVTGTET